MLLVLLLMVVVWGMLAYAHFFATRTYPNTTVQGVRIGAMTRAEATRTLQSHFASFARSPVTVTYGDHTWAPTLAELGIQLDIEAAVDQALAVGHHPRPVESLPHAAAIMAYGWDVPLRLTVDQPALQAYLATHLASLEHTPVDAKLVMDGTLPVVLPHFTGQQVLVDATMQDVLVAVQTLSPQHVTVRTRPIPPLLDTDAALEAHEEVSTLLQAPLIVEAGEQRWTWPATQLVKLLSIERTQALSAGHDAVVVEINRDVVQVWLREIAAATRQKPIYPRVNWNGGDLAIFREGVPGKQVDRQQAETMIVEALWSSDRTVTLPFEPIPVPRTSADLAQLGIRELISVGRSDFEDSEDYRITNIIAGMRLLHGVLVPTGEEFSFNETIGSISEENGFVKGWAIVDGRSRIEWGGGICQDSTTMMRAAFWAGLPITERWNHSHYLSWYDKYGYGEYGNGPGIDSTIFLGGADLKFLNDTGAWILIQAYANPENSLAEIRFYGTKGGRTVELAGPRISYRSNGGMDVAFTRIIKQDGIEVDRKTYWSGYTPW
jgi:vancomycin resistance protein YoaR